MNVDTLTLIRRTYPDLVDDLLTAVVGGVVNEPITFDLKQLRYALSQPAKGVRSVKGSIPDAEGNPSPEVHLFQANIDYVFSDSDSAIEWQPKGTKPLDESTFYVDYFRPDTRSLLTDINIGSVTRTLTEAIGRETATLYQQVYQAYLAGFVDTASGQSLDYVVSILGVVRRSAEYATGLASFLRDPKSSGNVTIPDGTLVSTAKRVVFETTELRTLQQGQQRIDVPIRASVKAKGAAGVVPPGAIVQLEAPIEGIASVTNVDATALGTVAETDDALRIRAKATLQGLGQATLAALKRALLEEKSELLEVHDLNGPPGQTSNAGEVTLLVSAPPARYAAINARVQETRAAGVLAKVFARYVFAKPRIALTLTASLTTPGKLKLVYQLIGALKAYFETLQAGEAAEASKMLDAMNAIPEVKAAKPRFLDVLTTKSDFDSRASDPLIVALTAAAQASSSTDAAALTAALRNVLEGAATPATRSSRSPPRVAARTMRRS